MQMFGWVILNPIQFDELYYGLCVKERKRILFYTKKKKLVDFIIRQLSRLTELLLETRIEGKLISSMPTTTFVA